MFKLGDLIFVTTRQDLASGKIRAGQVAEALGARSILSSELGSAPSALIYVKGLESPEVMYSRKKAGFLQIYDPVDNYDMKYIRKRQEYIDGFIASSVSHKIMMKKRFSAPVESIPHHSCNFSGLKISVKKNGNITPGYIGDITHYKALKFVEKKRKGIYKDFKYKNLDKSYLSIDIGLAYRKDKEKIKLNSSLKLVNYMSYGIPSIVNPERGYSEIGNHGEHCLFASSKSEFLENLEYLEGDYEMRKKMSDSAFLKAKDYNISNISIMYKDYLRKYFGINGK